MATDILDLIDHAIDDYTSGDAMRWTPEPPPPAAKHPVYGLLVPPPALTTWQGQALAAQLAQVGATLRPLFEDLGRAVTRFMAQIAPLLPAPRRCYSRKHHARPAPHPVRYKTGRRR